MNNALVKRGYDRLPSVFGFDAFDKIFEDMFSTNVFNELYSAPQGYPTDVVEVKDDKGNVIGSEITVALAGIPKENVDIAVDRDVLNISINKVEKEEDKNRNYLRKGISQRSMQLRYGLHGIDKDKIKANLVDGMLKVELPLAEEIKPRKVEIG